MYSAIDVSVDQYNPWPDLAAMGIAVVGVVGVPATLMDEDGGEMTAKNGHPKID